MFSKIRNLKPLKQYTDEELVAEFAKSQEPRFFGELYNRYAHLAFGVGLKYLKDESRSGDLVAEVFEILFKKIPTANIQSFKKYLYTVCRNEAIGKLRKDTTKRQKLEDFKIIEKNNADFMENEGLIRLLDNEPTLEAIIEKALTKLSGEQRSCIQLFFFQNKSYKEIVELTGFDVKQVKSFLQNGKRKLKILLEEDILKRKNS